MATPAGAENVPTGGGAAWAWASPAGAAAGASADSRATTAASNSGNGIDSKRGAASGPGYNSCCRMVGTATNARGLVGLAFFCPT